MAGEACETPPTPCHLHGSHAAAGMALYPYCNAASDHVTLVQVDEGIKVTEEPRDTPPPKPGKAQPDHAY